MSRNSQEDDMERPVSAGRVIADDKVSVVEEIKEKLIDPSKTSLMKNDDPRENMPSETGRSEPDRRPMSRMSSRSSKWEEVSELDPSVENKWKELLRKHNIGSAPSQKRKESLNDKGEEIDEKQGNEENPDLEMEEEEEKVSFRSLVEKHGIGSRSISRASLSNRRSGAHSRQGSDAGVINMNSHGPGLIPSFPEDGYPSTEHGFDTKENEVNEADDAECIEKENVVTCTKTENTSSSPVQSEPKENTSANEIIEKEEVNLDLGSAQNTDLDELNKDTDYHEEDKEGMVWSCRVCWLLATLILI